MKQHILNQNVFLCDSNWKNKDQTFARIILCMNWMMAENAGDYSSTLNDTHQQSLNINEKRHYKRCNNDIQVEA